MKSWQRNAVITRELGGLGERLRRLRRSALQAPPPPSSISGRSALARRSRTRSSRVRAGRRLRGLVGLGVGDGRVLGEHVLGQREDDRAGSAGGRDLEGAPDELRQAPRVDDLLRPLAQRRERGAGVELLEGLAAELAARDLADQVEHRRGVLERGVHADRAVHRSGTPRDEAHARAAGELPVGGRHVRRARLVAGVDEPDRRVVQRVERREVALARDPVDHLDAVADELVDEDLPARARNASGLAGVPALRL